MADENDDNNVISAEDFAAAIAKMREHPEWDSFYADAPEGARMFLGLRFYLEAFGEKANSSQYETCLQEIEPELSLEDIGYLLRRNWSADVMGYLHDRMMKISVPKKRANRAERPVLPPHADESAMRTVVEPAVPDEPKPAAKALRPIRPQQENPAPETSDPDQYSYARIMAEKKMKRSIARALLAKEAILFACIALLVVGAAGVIWYSYEKRHQEAMWRAKIIRENEERQRKEREEAEAKSAALREKERLDRLAAEVKRRKEEDERRRAYEAERQKKAEEQRLARKEQEERAKAFREVETRFRNAKIDYWKNAPTEDRPGKQKQEMTFLALVVDGTGQPVALELTTHPNASMTVRRLSPEATPEDISLEEFGKFTEHTPFLIMREDRAYFCSATKRKTASAHAVPMEDPFDPALEEFGALKGAMEKFGLRRAPFRYTVYFRPKGSKNETKVRTVAYGDTVSRFEIAGVVEQQLQDAARRRSEARTLRKQTQQAKAAEQEARRQEAAGKSPKRTTWRRNINGEIIAPDSYAGKTSWWREKDAQDEARRRKAETRAMREAIDDERFERDNAVNNEKIEAILNSGEIVCRPER